MAAGAGVGRRDALRVGGGLWRILVSLAMQRRSKSENRNWPRDVGWLARMRRGFRKTSRLE
jgi:hypothetical protein